MHLVGVVLICNALDLYHHSIFAEQQMVHRVNYTDQITATSD